MYMAYLILMWIMVLAGQDPPRVDLPNIEIINTGKYINYQETLIEAGPNVGRILQVHYFPAINFYNAGRYREAEEQLTYVIFRPFYLEGNPRRPEFMSTACYLRGMIYLYHATGVGRFSMAKGDFETAVKWNPLNYVAYLELSRLYSTLGLTEEALSVLRHLLQLMPDESIAVEAQKEVATITQKAR
jgi:tetratricopeptide (TPR) repeat protein